MRTAVRKSTPAAVGLIKIDIAGLTFSDLTITDNGGNADVHIAGHGTITLTGVDASLLTEDDFLFWCHLPASYAIWRSGWRRIPATAV